MCKEQFIRIIAATDSNVIEGNGTLSVQISQMYSFSIEKL